MGSATAPPKAPPLAARAALRPALQVAGLTLLALALRLYLIGRADYWDDEVISIFAGRAPAGMILSAISDYSVHPPLYYLLLHYWMGLFGEGPAAIRVLSALLSAACIPAAYLLGRRLAGHGAGLWGAALLALAPFQIYHAQQARMYALLSLLVLLAALGFLAAWERGGWWRWALFGGCAAAGLYTHVYFPLSLLALNLWALAQSARERRLDLRRWAGLIAAQAGAGLLFLPFLPQLGGTVGGVIEGYWISRSSLADAVALPVLLSNGSSLLLARADPAAAWAIALLVVPAAAGLLLASGRALAAIRRADQGWPGWALLLLLVWAPPLAAALVSLLLRPILIDRSLAGIVAPICLLLGRAWHERRRDWRAGLLGLAFVATTPALLLGTVYRAGSPENDLRSVAAAIAAAQQPGDAVVFADWQTFDTALLTHPELAGVYVAPSPGTSRAAFVGPEEWRRRLRYMGWPHLDRVLPVAEIAPRHRRIWLVLTGYNLGLPYQLEVSKGWLDENARLVEQQDYQRAVVWLYELPR